MAARGDVDPLNRPDALAMLYDKHYRYRKLDLEGME